MIGLLLTWLALSQAPQNANPPWPGLWGPSRDATAAAAGMPDRPKGFKEAWRRKSAGGYAEVAIGSRALVTMELRGDIDYVVALDPRTGKDIWHSAIGPTYRGHDGSHDGPIATPAIDGGDVFAVGPHGHLVAVDAETGKERWRHDLVKAFSASVPAYGFGTSPLVAGPFVVVQTGGEKSSGLLAFERTTGRLAWSGPHAKGVHYSSPVLATLAGTRQIVAAAGDRVYSASPEDGRLLWSVAGPGIGEETMNPPIVLPDDRVLLTFWGEAVLLKIARKDGAFTATEVWRSPRLRHSQGPAIYRDGFIYGFGAAFLVCLDASNGEVRWRQRTYEGSLVRIGTHLLVLGRASGELFVVQAVPDKFVEVTRTTVFTPGATSITGPSVAGRRVYLRNVEEIVAVTIEGES
jgi:outer membrane protein assembly factor BamB